MRAVRRSSGPWRDVFLTLAALALVLKVMIPAGWMVGPSSDRLPFPLVICTGQGAVTLTADQIAEHPSPDTPAPDTSVKHAPCVFAGQGAAFDGPPRIEAAAVAFAFTTVKPPAPAPHRSGPGVTGPPLPARGPPPLSI